MRIDTNTTPRFTPITITLDTLEEAQALKMACSTRAIEAAADRRNAVMGADDLDALLTPIHQALGNRGVKYLRS